MLWNLFHNSACTAVGPIVGSKGIRLSWGLSGGNYTAGALRDRLEAQRDSALFRCKIRLECRADRGGG